MPTAEQGWRAGEKNGGKCLFLAQWIFCKCLLFARENSCKSLVLNRDRHASPYVFFENLLKWVVCRGYRGRESGFVKIGKAILGSFRPVFVKKRAIYTTFRQFSVSFGRFWEP